MKIIKVKSTCFLKWKSRMEKADGYKMNLIFLAEIKRILMGTSLMNSYEIYYFRKAYNKMLDSSPYRT